LTVVCLVLLVFAVRATMRAVRRRYWEGATGRAWWAGILIALSLFALWFEVGHHRQNALATSGMSAVTAVAGAHADCARFTEALFNLGVYDGYVYSNTPTVAHITNESCRTLASYTAGSKRDPTLDQVAAVHLIAHEAMHINGYWSEAEAECRAVQLNHLFFNKTATTETQARELQSRYFAEIYPNMRSDYVSRGCAEGGDLDVFPDRTTFP